MRLSWLQAMLLALWCEFLEYPTVFQMVQWVNERCDCV
ncbi:hypothetical protein F383_28650 [Gossypium arboreum]|uniref:Uncharacterized protein n=1 Tax=Gossypium arboreum TaxID=29729 RepID=A0A0B0P7R1_GOSAR|nr:hypothetical protein F383_28650 [Gossypium arboreum]